MLGVIVTVAVAAGLLLAHVMSFGDNRPTTSGPDTRAITLPDTLGSFQDELTVVKSKNPSQKQLDTQTKTQGDTARLTVAAYSKAYGGAAAAARSYADTGLEQFLNVVAVRAATPGLTIGPVSDPADLGLKVNMREIVTQGDAQCTIAHTTMTSAAEAVDTSTQITTVCQKSAGGVTVQVFGNLTGTEGLTTTVALVDEAWTKVTGATS